MLGWSMNLFRVRGIQLSVHASFFLLLAYAAWEGANGAGWLGAAWVLTGLLAMFACVTLHEFGHIAAAAFFGIRTSRVLLLPIGGMAEMESIPRRPRDEIIIALAGPAVNYAIIGLLMICVRFPADWDPDYSSLTFAELGRQLVLGNLIMGVFNLLPAFPMDGGRVLRALLAIKFPYLQATRIAAHTGKVVAIATAAYLVLKWDNYLAAVLFGFIIYAGQRELRAVERREREAAHWREIEARFFQPVPSTSEDEPPHLI
ncbi:MAG TPA: site-2 protease family protein [Rariglobus sp.]